VRGKGVVSGVCGEWLPGNLRRLRLQPNVVVDCAAQSLLAAQIPLSGLYGDMSQQELDLFEFATRSTREPRTGPPEIVRCEPLDLRNGTGIGHLVRRIFGVAGDRKDFSAIKISPDDYRPHRA
jgi:hypothetical protein